MVNLSIEISYHTNELLLKHNIAIPDVLELASEALLSVNNDMMASAFSSQFKEKLFCAFSDTSTPTTEDVVDRFFLEHNGDLSSFFSHAFRIGYARAYRIVSGLIERERLTRGGGYRLLFEKI